ncbi:MAG: FapA family protein [Bacillota bacterium]
MLSEDFRNILKEVFDPQQKQMHQKVPKDTLTVDPIAEFKAKDGQTANNLMGFASVKNGVIIVGGETENASAEVVVPDTLVLLVNGERHTGKVTVKKNDHLQVVLPEPQVTNGFIKINISSDRIEAFLEISPDMVTSYQLADQPPREKAYLKLLKKTDIFCSADYNDVMALMEQQGVSYGVDYALIKRITNQPIQGVFKIATGSPPGKPIDETIEFFFPLTEDNSNHPEDQKEVNAKVFSVEAETVLAIKKPGATGRPGVDVTGKNIAPIPPKPIRLVAGSNTGITKDGKTVVAKTAGRPCVLKQGSTYTFSVNPLFVHSGDVSVTKENIRFRGDVQVNGNVLDGTILHALGNVNIQGFVSFASIKCGGNVSIDENIFTSTIQAGCHASHFTRNAKALLSGIASEAEALADLADVVMARPDVQEQQVPLGLALLNLIDFKFPKFRTMAAELHSIINNNTFSLPKSVIGLLGHLRKLLPGVLTPDIEDTDFLRILASDIRFLQECADNNISYCSKVVIPYALNSRIESTGNVFVYGQGCYNTVIFAGGSVDVSGTFRGGAIESQGNVYISEAGSMLCQLTRIVIPASKILRIDFVYPSVVAYIGNHLIRFEHAYKDLKISIDQNGKVELQGIRLPNESCFNDQVG